MTLFGPNPATVPASEKKPGSYNYGFNEILGALSTDIGLYMNKKID